MPIRIRDYCHRPGCNAIAPEGKRYCVRHQREVRQSSPNKTTDKFYLHAAWFRTRQAVLSKNPLCELCGENLATTVHHVHERKTGGADYDSGNLQALCASCHSGLHAQKKIKIKKDL